ncbi:hypothetical protein CBR_g38188 [Chara braunii]|uniref:RNA helicase n=1 Tax=Chara braunii TaxID=69332 RepID=A0A388LPE0_CHABU|nr:hypothetical protein CBR_g38188 [Chara braunii]|eukprot:GBG84216.1 hypothetical protein CBR_g38188 [Chara braunii]
MPYVPPHLRGGNATKPSDSPPGPPPPSTYRSSSFGGSSSSYGGGGRDYGGGGGRDYGGGGGRSRDYGGSFGGGSFSRSASFSPADRGVGYGMGPSRGGGAAGYGRDRDQGREYSRDNGSSTRDRERDLGGGGGGGGGSEEDGVAMRGRAGGGVGGGGGVRRGPPEPVWPEWEPSERVRKLPEDQIAEVRQRLNVSVDVAEGSPPPPSPIESFEDMCLATAIMKDIAFHEYRSPTPIQAQAMPVALSGRDLLGCAETGSGKTAAFALPMIQHCLAQSPIVRGDGPIGLVLAPTRELAQQIHKEVRAFSRSADNFRSAIVVGGVSMSVQKDELRAGVQIVVATPGRLIDHLEQCHTSLYRVSYVVLDEADRMLDMGFEPQIRAVLKGLNKRHQTLLFSATMPEEIEALAQEYLDKPVRVKVGTVSCPTANVAQYLEKVPDKDKVDRLLEIVVEEAATAEKAGLTPPLTIVFTDRKTRCDDVAEALVSQGLKAAALHGGRSQGEREGALRDFRRGEINVLVATDVASRGLDVSGVAHVINLDLPKTFEDYVHRIGRTGRAGSMGRATSLYVERDMYLVAQIRHAITQIEAGNTTVFATGKAARRREREQAAAFREGRLADAPEAPAVGGAPVKVDEKYQHMLSSAPAKGVADEAWDD